MQVQYVYNEAGEKESVIIPFKEWEKIRGHITIQEEKKEKFDPAEFEGMYRDLDIDPAQEAKEIRDEWERMDI